MKGFWRLVHCQMLMLWRNKEYLVASFGIAFVSMVLFGYLFGVEGSSPFSLGLVDEDRSTTSSTLVEALKISSSLDVQQGERENELEGLRSGKRRVVMVIPSGFEDGLARGGSRIDVYFDQGNMVAATQARAVIQAIVDGLNRQLTGALDPITIKEEGITAKRLRVIDSLTPGLVGMMIMWANMFVGVRLISWRERGILKRLGVTPLRPFNLISSQIVAHVILSFLQAALLVAIGWLLFKVSVQGSYLTLSFMIALGSLCILSLGYIIGSFIKKSESANAVAMLISFPMMFLSGSYFPTDSAPSFIQPLVKLMPLTYLNHALREIINNGSALSSFRTDIFVLLAWTLGSLVLSIRIFRWQ
ncbi:MAG: ABC transporter permease [Chloroflexi bacterium]|nr:ABC transporter permease [Chloroflexota bacterium]